MIRRDNDERKRACMCACTWGTGGFQRMFFSGAGVKPVVPVGLFFRSRTTPLGSSLSLKTRFFSCQPTWLTGSERTWCSCFWLKISSMYLTSHTIWDSYHSLMVDLDHLVPSVDLPRQVCGRLNIIHKQPRSKPDRPLSLNYSQNAVETGRRSGTTRGWFLHQMNTQRSESWEKASQCVWLSAELFFMSRRCQTR